MKPYAQLLVSGALAFMLAALSSALSAQEQKMPEQKVSCGAVPEPVRAAFQKTFPKATMTRCGKEAEQGKTAYEISSKEGAVRWDVLFYPDGTLIVIEEAVAFDTVPDPVKQAVRQKYPNGKIALSEKVLRDSKVLYEFRIKQGRKLMEIVFDPEGAEVPVKTR
jgi:hypothetical protein